MAKGKVQRRPCKLGCGFLVEGGATQHPEGQCPKRAIAKAIASRPPGNYPTANGQADAINLK